MGISRCIFVESCTRRIDINFVTPNYHKTVNLSNCHNRRGAKLVIHGRKNQQNYLSKQRYNEHFALQNPIKQ